MAPDVLLHLVEPAAWRAALAEGALRPPSLDDVGFVHLSTPDQVHLPAERLYPGRRDLVLLVVDPARLTDPVRFEAGLPADPGGMLFPHLYGPLPTSAGRRRRPLPAARRRSCSRPRTTGSAGRSRTSRPSPSGARWASATCRAASRCSTPTTCTPTTTTACC